MTHKLDEIVRMLPVADTEGDLDGLEAAVWEKIEERRRVEKWTVVLLETLATKLLGGQSSANTGLPLVNKKTRPTASTAKRLSLGLSAPISGAD